MSIFVEKIIMFFLSFFLFGLLINGLTFLKYIGLVGAILFFLIYSFIDFKSVKKNFFSNFYQNKYEIILLLLFLISIVFSIIFSYSNNVPSFKEFRIEFLNIGMFFVITLTLDLKKLVNIFFYVILLAFLFNVLKFGIDYLSINKSLNFSIRLNRNFGTKYFVILYPFVLVFLVETKRKILRVMLLFVLLVGFLELFLTGARGGWITIGIETLLFILVFMLFDTPKAKNILSKFLIGSLVIGVFGIYLFKNSSLIQSSIHKGLSPNGRDVIVKTRFPIIYKNMNIFFGIGGPGNYQYNKLLNDKDAPKVCCLERGKYCKYYADEPFLLQIFYKEGLIGLFLFLMFSVVFLYKGYKKALEKKNMLLISVLLSFIGYYLVHGFVEGRELKYLILFIILYIIFSNKKEDEFI